MVTSKGKFYKSFWKKNRTQKSTEGQLFISVIPIIIYRSDLYVVVVALD